MELKQFLTQKRITATRAATELGISRQTIYNIYKGYSVSPKIAKRIQVWSDNEIDVNELIAWD